ncbi:hypothetical protein [Stutzerimonas marianensis]|uniref:hypothetical protein n=1 Tax=Stutzerimonas marianensis TaxID=2929513 RepID=UPI003C2DEFB6
MKTRLYVAVLALPVAAVLAACSQEDDEPSALRNVERNQQEFQNTATDPAGPRETTPPSNLSNE